MNRPDVAVLKEQGNVFFSFLFFSSRSEVDPVYSVLSVAISFQLKLIDSY